MLRVRLLGRLEVDAGVAGADVPAGRPPRLVLGWLAAFPGRACACRGCRPVVAGRARFERSRESAHRIERGAGGSRAGGQVLAGDARDGRAQRRGLVGRPARVRRAGRRRPTRGRARALRRRGAGRARRGVGVRAALAACGRASRRGHRASSRGEGGRITRPALLWARRLAAWAPLDETAERELMVALAAAGDRAGALRSYADFSRRLARELERYAFGADARAGVAATARGARYGRGGRIRPGVARAP